MARHSVLQTFYCSDKWREFRQLLIQERGPYCEQCKELVINTRELTAHHEIELTPDNVHDHMISLNPTLIKLLHHSCHNAIHNRFGAKRQRGVYLVYGPPMAGKKSFVREQMMRGDIVVDMDSLYEAISFQPSYDKPDNLFSNVMGVHNLLLDNIKTRAGKWGNAWIIGGYPESFKRSRVADQIGAELVFINADKDTCMSRLRANALLVNHQIEWQGYIDKWFAKYA